MERSTNNKKPSFNLFEGWKKGKRQGSVIFTEAIEVELDDDDDWEDLPQEEEEDLLLNNEEEGEETKKQDTEHDKNWWSGWADSVVQKFVQTEGDNNDEEEDVDPPSVEELVEKARSFHSISNENNNTQEGGGREIKKRTQDDLELLQAEIKLVLEQVQNSFEADLDLKLLNPISFNYFLEKQESVKTYSWKRRQHRYCDEVALEDVYTLHDALYLAEASYLDSVDDIQSAIAQFQFSAASSPYHQHHYQYELVYCQLEAEPRQPAHYIAILKKPTIKNKKKKSNDTTDAAGGPLNISHNKTDSREDSNSNTTRETADVLDVLLVVRGTKEISDALTDCLLESTEYRNGLSHDGVCQAGQWLAQQHADFFQHLIHESGRSSMRLTLLGHSLGAGAAAIACIEFNQQYDNIDATCIGFGCPALLSLDLSNEWKEKIITVVGDADCVPRMSKATVSNLILDVMSNDWTDQASTDVFDLLRAVQVNVSSFLFSDEDKEKVFRQATEYLKTQTKPDIDKISTERSEVELFPPGTCMHLYRNGQTVSFNYVSCDFFREFDVRFTMADDHLVSLGYNRLFHEHMRDHTHSRFFFPNNVNALRFEKHLIVVDEQQEEKDDGNK